MKPLNAGKERLRAGVWGALFTGVLTILIVTGSRNLGHFDAALVGYTFATLFAVFGITYRYTMWLQRPPTRMYWRRGWETFLTPSKLPANVVQLGRRALVEFAANRFIFRRGRLRGLAHWSIMWGCVLAAAITFPLVWGWVHFETVPGDLESYRAFVFGVPTGESIAICRRALGDRAVIGSGGVRTGMDVAVAIALGADAAALAKPLLEAAAESEDAAVRALELLIYELRVVCFCAGASSVAELRKARVIDLG